MPLLCGLTIGAFVRGKNGVEMSFKDALICQFFRKKMMLNVNILIITFTAL